MNQHSAFRTANDPDTSQAVLEELSIDQYLGQFYWSSTMSQLWDNTVSHIEEHQKSAHGRDSKLSFSLNVQRQKATKTFSDRVVFSVKTVSRQGDFS